MATGTLDTLRDLRRSARGRRARARIFLAGRIPEQAGLEPPPVIVAHRTEHGIAPRHLESAALEETCRRLNFRPTSLHARGVSRAVPPPDWLSPPSPADCEAILRGLARLRDRAGEAHRELGGKRAPRDPVCRTCPMALTSSYIKEIATAIIEPFCEDAFDTAYVDEKLVRDYAKEGVKAIHIGSGILLPEPQEIQAACRATGLELLHAELH
ncbi:MAG TPA: hypothetical protein VF759_05525 [Allosphingosinicella sp.]